MAALVPLLLNPSVAEVQFQVILFFRGIYSKDLYRSPIEPFVVVYSGGLLPRDAPHLPLLEMWIVYRGQKFLAASIWIEFGLNYSLTLESEKDAKITNWKAFQLVH
jgi:hypothetical protein